MVSVSCRMLGISFALFATSIHGAERTCVRACVKAAQILNAGGILCKSETRAPGILSATLRCCDKIPSSEVPNGNQIAMQ